MWRSILVLCLVWLFLCAGCASVEESPEPELSGDAIAQVTAVAAVLMKLAALDRVMNRQGFDDLSQRYGVDITTPVLEVFRAVKTAIAALRKLAFAMTSRDVRTVDFRKTVYPELYE